MDERVDAVIEDRFDDYREALFSLLRQPSVSATGEGMDAAPELVGDLVDEHGFDDWERIETSHAPLIYAERLAGDDAPTVVFYGHYDVQPPGEAEEWETPAFEPTVRDESIYARGAGDNKGQLSTHVFAVDALVAADAFPDVNVKLLFEGGEESGSLGLREYLDGDAAEIADADLVYVADGPVHRSGRPTLIYGNRGILSAQLDHETANTDLHSGNFGGPIPNAATELVEVVSSMVDGDEVTVDGFHDGVNVTDADRELVSEIPDDSAEIMADLDLDRLATDEPYYERLLLEPTLTVNGLLSGYTGEGGKTIIPHESMAKLDMRLVPDQDPDEVFEAVAAHVERENPDVQVTKGTSFPPMKTPVDTPASDDVAAALEDVWGVDPVEMPVLGGSLPAAYFQEALDPDLPVLVVPYANADQGNHSPNEHLDLEYFRNGIRATAAFLLRYGA
jgi:acetylornithine deacetylase/succinyl-diaminopimelate desuccinylase-like protein